MDVRCERCRAEYVVDDARIPEAGVKVACTQCGHGFLLKKKVLAVAVPLKGGDGDVPISVSDLAPSAGSVGHPGEGADRGDWRLRQESGAVFPFRELSTLQRWIVERKASRDDEVASAGEGKTWRRLGDIPELRSFFSLVERASRAAEPRGERQTPDARSSPGMEDPAWASDPGQPPRRITRSLSPAARPRRRVVWVALLVLALLGVAAGTVYLRRGAEAAAAAAKATLPQPAPAVVEAPPKRAVRVPAVPGPAEAQPPVTEPGKEPGPPSASPTGPAAEAPTGPVTEASSGPPPGPTAAIPTAPLAEPKPAARPSPRDDATPALRALLTQAREQRDRGRCEASLDLYGRALAIDGRNAAALAGRGACYLDLSRYAQAEASFEGALESDPRNAEALFGLAETYRYMGKKGDAVAWYEKFLAVRPTGDDAAAARRLISQLKE
jgi:predicted Zn finger-like uncharacterized protein